MRSVSLSGACLFLTFVHGLAVPVKMIDDRPAYKPSEDSLERARRVLAEHPIIDGHNDFPMALRDFLHNDLTNFNFNMNLSSIPPWSDSVLDHTDLPRMREGQMGGQFWSAFIGCSAQYKDAVQLFIEQVDVIKRFVAMYPDDMMFVTSPDGIEQSLSEGKIASLIGVESGHAIGSNLGMLRILYELGVRYMTLTHGCNTPWADAAQVESGDFPARSHGLSEFGKTVVKEMNRLGMLVDISHVSKETMVDAIQESRAPVIFSHSSARAICSHPRNVPDDVLEKLPVSGGIVMVNTFACFVRDGCDGANLQDMVAHVNHIRNVTGVDHIGIGGDFNGIFQTTEGLEDVSKYPNLFAGLIESTDFEWTDEDLAKLANKNIIRVFREVEGVRDELAYEEPYQEWIPKEDLAGDTSCMSEVE